MSDVRTIQHGMTLEAYLAAGDESLASAILVGLVDERVVPIVMRSVSRRLNVSLRETDDRPENERAADLVSEAQVLVIDKLIKLRQGTGAAIGDLDAYVNRVAANVCNRYLRQKYPRRFRLKNQLRYLLSHHPDLTSWQSNEAVWLCYFRGRGGEQRPSVTRSLERELIEKFQNIDISPDTLDLSELVKFIFESAGGPVRFADLLTHVYALQRIEEPKELSSDDVLTQTLTLSEQQPAGNEDTGLLSRIWAEIKQLPLRHRLALVLSLRSSDGESPITLLPDARVATVREIAEVLDIDPARFASIWNELPLDDHSIADHLNISRQQVINLRHWARVTLKRRLAAAERG